MAGAMDKVLKAATATAALVASGGGPRGPKPRVVDKSDPMQGRRNQARGRIAHARRARARARARRPQKHARPCRRAPA